MCRKKRDAVPIEKNYKRIRYGKEEGEQAMKVQGRVHRTGFLGSLLVSLGNTPNAVMFDMLLPQKTIDVSDDFNVTV